MIPGPEKSVCLLRRKDRLELWRIGLDRLEAFSNTVYEVYRHAFDESDLDRNDIIAEDMVFFSCNCSIFFAVTAPNGGDVICTFRLAQKNRFLPLPIETTFNLDCCAILNQLSVPEKNAWHGGRLSINKPVLYKHGFAKSKSLELLRDINTYIFNFMGSSGETNTVLFCELDRTAKRIYGSIGLPFEVVGEPLYYMGSVTYPVILRLKDLDFPDIREIRSSAVV